MRCFQCPSRRWELGSGGTMWNWPPIRWMIPFLRRPRTEVEHHMYTMGGCGWEVHSRSEAPLITCSSMVRPPSSGVRVRPAAHHCGLVARWKPTFKKKHSTEGSWLKKSRRLFHLLYTPRSNHGSGTWPLGRLFSSANRWFSTSMIVSGRVVPFFTWLLPS